MKYLLTGVAGFIGYKVADLLLESGHEVVGIDNLNPYYDIRLKTHRLQKLASAYSDSAKGVTPDFFSAGCHGQFSFQPGDIEDLTCLRNLFRKHRFDAVLNLAARAGVRYSMENPFVYFTTNTTGVLNLLELMREFSVRKIVLASTSSLYAGLSMPFTEDLPVNTPISPYAASKKAAEVLSYTYHNLYAMDVSVLRYFTVYGPAGRPDMSPLKFIHSIAQGQTIPLFGDGTQARDFTYLDDIARGTIAALRPVGYEIINLGGGNEPVRINTVIGWMQEMLGREAKVVHHPFHQADMRETWADISKARNLLGWTPQIPVREGFQQTVDWYRENESWLKSLNI